MKQILLSSLLFMSGMIFFSSCTTSDLVTAIVAIDIVLDDGPSHPHHPPVYPPHHAPHYPPVQPPHHNPPVQPPHSHHYSLDLSSVVLSSESVDREANSDFELMSVYLNDTLSSEEAVQKFSAKYNIPTSKTSVIFGMITDMSKGNYASAEAIGINKDILRNLSFGKKITDNKAAQVANKLGLSAQVTKVIFDDISNNVYKNIMDTDSQYWQYCTRNGSWKTNQNAHCTSLMIQGCSPKSIIENELNFDERVICVD